MDNRVRATDTDHDIGSEDGGRSPRSARHIVNLLTLAAVLAAIYLLFFRKGSLLDGLESLLYAGLVIVGIGLLIFIHELGHFLAAKLCDTKVEVFSVGFGPPIPGCSFQYGETFYKLAVCPIGGYVKLPGENPGDVDAEEIKKDPRLLPNKSVGQRLLIFSAGVVMNILLAAVFFVIVYLNGKEERAGLLGVIDPGSPAARAGLVTGSRLLEVDGKRNPTFEDLFYATALARPNRTEVRLRWVTPWGEEREGILIPRKLPTDIKPVIGIGYGYTLELPDMKIKDEVTGRKRRLESRDFGTKGSPVEKASFEPGDLIIGIRKQGAAEFQPLQTEYDRLLAEHRLRKHPVEYQVQRGAKVVVPVEPELFRGVGIQMTMGPIVSITNPKYTPKTANQFQEGDVIVGVEGQSKFDPMRLPDLCMDAVDAKDEVTLDVLRGGSKVQLKFDATQLRQRGLWGEERPIHAGSLVGIPALGIAYRVLPTVSVLDATYVALTSKDDALPKLTNLVGGKLVKVSFPRSDGTMQDVTVADDEYHWPFLFFRVQSDPTKPIKLTVEGVDGRTHIEEVTPYAIEGWHSSDRGFFAFEPAKQLVVAEGVLDAIRIGTIDTGRFVIRIYQNLRSLLVGDLSVKLLSGPIKMFEQTYAMAEQGPIWLLWFLGVISINLAVVNFLPIPVLDGGHVMFLLIEKIRGKRASERVFMIANAIGLTTVLALMLFVLCLDFTSYRWVQRLFGM